MHENTRGCAHALRVHSPPRCRPTFPFRFLSFELLFKNGLAWTRPLKGSCFFAFCLIFTISTILSYLGLWSNRSKTVNKHSGTCSFGSLTYHPICSNFKKLVHCTVNFALINLFWRLPNSNLRPDSNSAWKTLICRWVQRWTGCSPVGIGFTACGPASWGDRSGGGGMHRFPSGISLLEKPNRFMCISKYVYNVYINFTSIA